MNFYKIQGRLTAWTSDKLRRLGFKNIEGFTEVDNIFYIEMKNKELYSITFTKLKNK